MRVEVDSQLVREEIEEVGERVCLSDLVGKDGALGDSLEPDFWSDAEDVKTGVLSVSNSNLDVGCEVLDSVADTREEVLHQRGHDLSVMTIVVVNVGREELRK